MPPTTFWCRGDSVALAPAPPGITPNFVDPPTRTPFVISSSIGYVGYCMGLRSNILDDDVYYGNVWFRTPRMGYPVLNFQQQLYESMVPFPSHSTKPLKADIILPEVGAITGTFYGMSIMLTKLSILAFYLRFVIASAKLRGVIYVTIVLTILYSLIASFVWVYACQPLEKYWDLTITDGSCINFLKVTIFSGVMNTATDAIILLLPIAILRGLRLQKRQKLGVMVIMMTGGLWVFNLLAARLNADAQHRVLGISVVRLKATVDSLSYQDLTWDSVPGTAWWSAFPIAICL
ncbi:hypothetical protein ACJA88_015169 [Fusarium oxysporum]